MASASLVSSTDMPSSASPNDLPPSRLPLLQRRLSTQHPMQPLSHQQQQQYHNQQQDLDALAFANHPRSSGGPVHHRASAAATSSSSTATSSAATTIETTATAAATATTQQDRQSLHRQSLIFGGRPPDTGIPAPAPASSRVPGTNARARKHLSFRTSLINPEALKEQLQQQLAREAADDVQSAQAEALDGALDRSQARSSKRASLIPTRRSHIARFSSIDSESSDYNQIHLATASKLARQTRRPTAANSNDQHASAAAAAAAAAATAAAAAAAEALGMRAEDLSYDLSDYDDSTAQDTTSATDIDDSADNDVSDFEGDNSFGFPSPMFAPKHSPPHLKLEQVSRSVAQQEGPRTYIDDSPQSSGFGTVPELNKPLPRSPGQTSPLGSVFGGDWRGPTPPATEASSAAAASSASSSFSSSSASATTLASPLSSAKNNLTHDGRRSTKGSFIVDDNHHNQHGASSSSSTTSSSSFSSSSPPHNRHADNHFALHSPSSPSHPHHSASMMDDMEDELKAISSELAASIRREIDLEDLVDRLQDQIGSGLAPNKRSSDYFSDSGYSSAKVLEVDPGREEIDKIRRRSEQEKASIRLELVNKLQDERSKRKVLNRQIKELAEKASHVDIAHINSLDANDRIRNLEETCEELRRKLSQERESRGGFEDLLAALRSQLRDVSDERDNLKDEVIPELRARIDGLEAEATAYSGLTYESARMQQQLDSLRQENTSLRSSIASVPPPDEPPASRLPLGLSRSNSLGPAALRGASARRQQHQQHQPLLSSSSASSASSASSLARCDSFKNATSPATTESRDDLAQRLKDVEAQRDALHSALKSLLERHEHQNREHLKKVRALETERQRLLTSAPRKAGFEKDMSKLRVEVNILRRRAEEALEQKWQVEKGLGGLKMDLDRAEEEIESLRNLLNENDILIPPFLHHQQLRDSIANGDGSHESQPVSSESLQRTYDALCDAYAESLERIKRLEAESEAGVGSEAQESAARRLEDMASQVQQQLATNSELRDRLSAAVARGETDRKALSQRISEMQERLRGLEEQVVHAQMGSEELVTRHEEDMAKMQESQNPHLRRFQAETRGTASHKGPRALVSGSSSMSSSMSSSSASAWASRSSIVGGQTLRAPCDKSFEDEAEIKTLRAKVAELEKTLAETEKEMQEVVARMSLAQVEVLNLQEAREAAVRETRRLEQLLRQEHSSGLAGLFRRA